MGYKYQGLGAGPTPRKTVGWLYGFGFGAGAMWLSSFADNFWGPLTVGGLALAFAAMNIGENGGRN